MSLLTLDQALDLDFAKANELYARHLNPELFKIYRALGFDDLDITAAEGVELRLANGRTVLDFSSAIGVAALGHNHPRIIAAEARCHERKVVDALKVAPTRLQGALAYNLSQVLPAPLEVAFLAVSGAEAVEAAMKICEKAQGPNRRRFVTTSGSYHGKTHGAMAVTTSGGFQRGFLMGIPAENVLTVPYGDLAALEALLAARGSECIALLVEAIQGQGMNAAPAGYLKGAAELCRQHGVLTIFDEVKAGMGRTGTFCAFEIEAVVPDVVTLSKALGGGTRAIAAMVSSRALFDRAYGNRKDCALHTSTFSGLGTSCAVAIETLNIYRDDGLVARAGEAGRYLEGRLQEVAARHPGAITEIRGRGLMRGLRFDYNKSQVTKLIGPDRLSGVLATVDSVCMASTIRELYKQYGILCHFSASDPDLLHIMPPLVVTNAQLDTFAAAIDDILTRGLTKVVAAFVAGNAKGMLGSVLGG